MHKKITGFLLALCALIFAFNINIYAMATDEITDYEITVDVNDDASLLMKYHIEWLVLDSDSLGPVDWLSIGVPNIHARDLEIISDNITGISMTTSGGYNIRLDLDRNYYENELIVLDFSLVQDYMYQVNKLKDGETVYSFTPGWFDDVAVDNLTIRWNNDKAIGWSPECQMDKGYNIWNASLSPGGKYPVTMTYPNDAYAFDLSVDDSEEFDDDFFDFFAGIIAIGTMLMPIIIIIICVKSIKSYAQGANFEGGGKKITRTVVKYYSSCPGCGAPRKEGEKFCSYCGKSLVESEETITEEELKKQYGSASGFNSDGEYRYSSMPNTYIRVHTVPIPRPVTRSSSSFGSGGSHHSSCAHSSCACACACACAGGGRAGCSTKDFYNTQLKLNQIKRSVGKYNGR